MSEHADPIAAEFEAYLRDGGCECNRCQDNMRKRLGVVAGRYSNQQLEARFRTWRDGYAWAVRPRKEPE